jgi:hypothetical protein
MQKRICCLYKKNWLGAGKTHDPWHEPEIDPWERRRLAGQFHRHTPAGRQRSQVKFTS